MKLKADGFRNQERASIGSRAALESRVDGREIGQAEEPGPRPHRCELERWDRRARDPVIICHCDQNRRTLHHGNENRPGEELLVTDQDGRALPMKIDNPGAIEVETRRHCLRRIPHANGNRNPLMEGARFCPAHDQRIVVGKRGFRSRARLWSP